jgi:long-chain acyl-CoA synthetase
MASSRPFAWEKSYPAGVRWDTPLPTPSTLPALLREAASAYGVRTAIEFRDRHISYSRLLEEADRFADALLGRGIGPGDALALYLPNTPYHPFAFFGACQAGVRVVHLSPLDAERELVFKLRDSGARTLVTTDTGELLATALNLLDAGIIDLVIVGEDSVWTPLSAPGDPLPDRPEVVSFANFVSEAGGAVTRPHIRPDDVALLQYTGGTTGMPKGAILTHANLTAAIAIYDAWLHGQGFSEPGMHKVICVLPLFHIYALTTILLRHIKNGNEILLRSRFDVETTLRDIEVKKATVFPGVPTMWIALTNHPEIAKRDLSSLVHCASGGAPLPVEVDQRFERLTGLKLRGGWGMTETSPAGTNLPREAPTKPGTIGIPLPGIEMDIVALDDPARRLPPREVGEIRIKGPNVTSGYWNQPEETAAAFVDGYFLTGDIGYMDEDGYFFIVDRKKDMIICGGFNVYPQMVEQAIHEHPQVQEAAVIGVPDDYRGEAAKAFVKLREGAAGFSLEELHCFLAGKVGRHAMPRELEFRPNLPRTPVGKLSKRALREEELRKHNAAMAAQGLE